MLAAIVRFSLRFRGIVIALAAVLVGYGLYSLAQAYYDVFPEFALPQVVIQTEAPGLAPEQVEALVTQPIENALGGLPGIDALRSGSIQGLSVITVTFGPGSEIFRDRQSIAERLTTVAGDLPAGVAAPEMTPLTSSTSTVMALGITSRSRGLMDMRTVADWTIRPRLLAVPGVAKVSIFGGEVRQLQVQVTPDLLIRHGLGLDDVVAAARRATGVRGAGVIDTANQRLAVTTEAQALTAEQLARTVVAFHAGAAVTLGEVATVVDAPEPPIGAATIMGKPGVILEVSAQYGANTLAVTREVDHALAELRPVLQAQGIELDANVHRPAKFITTATDNVRSALLLGGLLVVVVLALFLFDLRTAAISCTAIPLSLLAAITVLERAGVSLNTMTLGGLAIAIGEVVDDAVIDVENILRRLRANRAREAPLPALRVVLDASIEVRGAVVYATLAVILVFVPILTMTGVAGRLFAPLGLAYVLAILASLAVALTVTPAMCAVLLVHQAGSRAEPPLPRWLKLRYRPVLLWVEKRPLVVMAGVALLTLGALATLPFLEGSFVPELKEGHFIVHMTGVPGTSLDESLRLGGAVTAELLKLPFVRSVAQRAGRAEAADDILGTHSSEFEVDLKPLGGEESERAESAIRASLAQVPGATFAVNTFLTERVEETLSGYAAPVAVKLFGPDLGTLEAKAQEVATALAKVAGAVDVAVASPVGSPQVTVRVRRTDLRRWGLTPVEVIEAVRTAYQGEVVGQVFDGNRVVSASVILDPAIRRRVEAVASLPLRNPAGTYVPLAQVADVFESTGRYAVLHDGARRVQAVTCSVAGRSVAAFVSEARRRIAAAVELPGGTYVQFAGSAAEQARSRRDLLVHAAIAGVGILLLLTLVVGRARNLLLVLANLPFALVGGVAVVLASGGELSIGSLVGFVTLFGITLRNSIMLISHFEHLVAVEGETWGLEAALRGAQERLAPILMTALVTGGGLLPLALGGEAPGREIEGPMALVILGGLVTSTALNLLVLPSLAVRFGRFEPAASDPLAVVLAANG
ncbi:MAG: efflux RND transporter permease subunit [Thermoanaerobaculales bacterium]